MLSRPVAVALLAGASVTGAAGGAFLASRHDASPVAPVDASAPVAAANADGPAAVEETEALVVPEADARKLEAPAPARRGSENTPPTARKRPAASAPRTAPPPVRQTPGPASHPAAAEPPTAPQPELVAAAEPRPVEAVRPELPPLPPMRIFEDVTVPGSSVLGLQIETPVSSERARLEDRVEARVLRDVVVDGRTAIPAGSRAIGSVTLVEQGGKLKERARLGVRFHTLVLADGSQLPMRTDTIMREGDSPSGESARKIGGAAAGGAILGAIIGGKKGAVLGGATGAAGGTAVVFAGDRNPATLPVGAVVTVRLSEPLVVEIEKR